jgi:hypothetical protein
MRTLRPALLVAALSAAASALAACGGDDTANPNPADGGSDTSTVDSGGPVDSGGGDTATNDSGAGDTGGDGEAGPCDFAVYVKGLITSSTNETSKPVTDLGESCTDKQSQADFASLFP